jgi:hypothetical protein
VIRFDTGLSPSDRITATPRALFRVVIERAPGAYLSYASGWLNWREQVQKVVDNSSNPAAYYLGGGVEAVLVSDRVATLNFVAKSTAGSSVTIADLVNAIDRANPYARVVSIARVGVVPATSAGGIDKLASDTGATQDDARKVAETTGIVGALKSVRTVVIVAIVVAAAIGAYRLFPTKASTAP